MDIFEINWHHFPFFFPLVVSLSHFGFVSMWIFICFTQCAVDGPLFRGSSSSIFFPHFPASVRFNWQTFKLNDAHFSIHLPQFASYKLLTRQRPKNPKTDEWNNSKSNSRENTKKRMPRKKIFYHTMTFILWTCIQILLEMEGNSIHCCVKLI